MDRRVHQDELVVIYKSAAEGIAVRQSTAAAIAANAISGF